ncbi:phage minor head protein [Modestobacter sp. KNN46-3]|uniref:phage minor head protein n=1 Tax=Modestobacter sp. KNN46-3 TaxID=2711218 RepID=UPI0013DF83B6|nr:phage minor head protein [Modestobacter sp. KNN46-3]
MTARQNIEQVAVSQRVALAADSKRVAGQLARAYATVWQSVQRDLGSLQRRIDAERAAGRPVSTAWLERESRYQRLLSRLEEQLLDLAPVAGRAAAALADAALAAGAADAAALVEATGVQSVLGTLNVGAAQEIVAVTSYGPLVRLLEARAGGTVTAARDVLREAVMRGWAPAKTAAELRRVTNGALSNAMTVARTEQLRAYREASRQSYIDNPAVTRWRWSSRLVVGRTCPACWAMHGTEFDLNTPMGSHPNCMCTLLPVVPLVNYGLTGPERFARLTAEQQRTVLGPAAFAAFADGAVSLADLVSERRSPEWGVTRSTGSLTAALGPVRSAQYLRP